MNYPRQNILWNVKNEVLTDMRHYLCQYIDPQTYFTFLRSRQCLNEEDEELILSEKTKKKRMAKFLDLLPTKGPKGFDDFCDAILDNGTQTFVAKELNMLYEKKFQALCLTELDAINIKPSDRNLPIPKSSEA